MRSIALVIRRSKKDEQQVSLSRQERLGREWAASYDPTLPVLVFGDNGVSGEDMSRDGWVEFVDAVRADRIGAVWAYEQSRLTRAGLQTWDEVIVMLDRAGLTELHTYSQGQISVRMGNRLQGRLLALVDQEELEKTKVRMRDAQLDLARQGRPGGGRLFGYRRVRDEDGRAALEVDEDQALVVKEMAHRVLDGWPLLHIAKDLTERGVPTSLGGRWTNQQVRAILTKPTMAGLRGHYDQVYEGRWTPILERDLWERVCAELADARTVIGGDGRPRRVPRHARRGRRYLLTGGVAFCGKCGTAMIAQVRSTRKAPGKQAAYSCQRGAHRPDACGGVSIVAEPFERYVIGRMLADLQERGVAGRMDEPDDPRVALIAELGEAERRQRHLAEDYATGLLGEGPYRDGLAIVAARVEVIRSELDRVGLSAVPELDDPQLLAARWDDLTLARQRQIIATAVGAVTVMPGRPGAKKFDPERIRLGERP